MKTRTPEAQAAKALQAHHEKTAAGFYPSNGGRAFGARVRAGRLEIFRNFETWQAVDLALVTFSDHNGRAITIKATS